MRYREDASDQTAEHNDAMAAEAWDHNLWADPEDDRPSAAELADDFDFDWRAEQLRGWGRDV